ncbi:MAG: hypothetical protein IPH13_04960 [Planctomycetes bacterium]|nr:hypothetical protein [Planctomycetota bacterium]MCC7172653.1 hypothetical protein [Planctomycetota bacterium]
MNLDDALVRSLRRASESAILAALTELGYVVRWRDAEWCECLLWREGEQWLGQGPTRDAALANAVALALPSHAARVAFEAWLSAPTGVGFTRIPDSISPERIEPSQNEASPAIESSDAESRVGASGAVAAFAPDAMKADASAPPHTIDSSTVENVDVVTPPLDERSVELDSADVAALARSEQPSRPRRPLAEILREFDALRDACEQDLGELALASPERQRLLLLAWTARGRGLVHESRHARDVDARMRGFAAILGDLSKQLWPGSVVALGKDASPADCASTLPHAKQLADWFDVSDAALAELELAEQRDDRDGCDEYGYADAGELEPRSNHPDTDLREVVATIERISGLALDDSTRKLDRPVLRDDDGPALIRCAQHLRWLRGTASFRDWGLAIGRMRWLEGATPRLVRSTLRELLDPRHRPPTSWAQQLGQDPEKRRRIQRKNDLLGRRPRAEANPADASVAEWLLEAFDAGDDLPSPKIAACLTGFESRIDAIRELVLAGERDTRQNRRRMKNVVRHLQQPNSDVANARRELEQLPVDVQSHEPATPPLETRLLDAVLPSTRGKRAVLVTNRNDPELDDVLRATFEFAELDHVESKPSRIQGISERIASASYEIVLVATGFQSHATDERLQPAARQAGALYARVNRARRSACIHAVARELGVLGDIR